MEGKKEYMNKDNVVELLIAQIPEIEDLYVNEMTFWSSHPGNHIVFGDVFNPFLEKILKHSGCIKLKKRIFEFLEKMALCDDDAVVNVLIVTILEKIGDDKKILSEAKKYMGKRTCEYSDEVEEWWRRA